LSPLIRTITTPGSHGLRAGRLRTSPQILTQLNGHVYLLRGNHDRWRSDEWFKEAGFMEIYREPVYHTEFERPPGLTGLILPGPPR